MVRAAPRISALFVAGALSLGTSAAHAQSAAQPAAVAPAPAPAAVTPAPAPEGAPEAAPTPAYAAPAPPPHHTSHTARDVGWISLGIGSAAAVAAIVTSIVALHDDSVRKSHCDAQHVCDAEGFNANSQLDSVLAFNAAAWAVAVVGVGVGLTLVLTHPADRSSETAIVVAPNGTGAGLSLRSTF